MTLPQEELPTEPEFDYKTLYPYHYEKGFAMGYADYNDGAVKPKMWRAQMYEGDKHYAYSYGMLAGFEYAEKNDCTTNFIYWDDEE